MRLLQLALCGILSLTTEAFDLTAYDNVADCKAQDDTMYRTLEGPGVNQCYTFGRDMVGTECWQYNRGGEDGPVGCIGGSLIPKSIRHLGQNEACYFFEKEDCQGRNIMSKDGDCVGTAAGTPGGTPGGTAEGTLGGMRGKPPHGIEKFKSFYCHGI